MECPCPAAETRLRDAHQLWHDCLTNYQSPATFRTYLNYILQALRSFPEVVNAQKRRIPNFANWAQGWSASNATEPYLEWLNSARVEVFHIGDLDLDSITAFRLYVNYDDAASALVGDSTPRPIGGARVARAETSANEIVKGVLDDIFNLPIPPNLLRRSTLAIERRWSDEKLPDVELLGALAQCFNVHLAALQSLHRFCNSQHDYTIRCNQGDHHLDMSSRSVQSLSCMHSSRDLRTGYFSMADGQPLEGSSIVRVPYDETVARAASGKYKRRRFVIQTLPTSATDRVREYFENGRAIILSGEEHGWFIWFFRGGRVVDNRVLSAATKQDKHILAQQIATLVSAQRYDGVITCGELYESPEEYDTGGAPIPPEEHPQRVDVLGVHAETADGRSAGGYLRFRRRPHGRPKILDETTYGDGAVVDNFLAPTRLVWASWAKSDQYP